MPLNQQVLQQGIFNESGLPIIMSMLEQAIADMTKSTIRFTSILRQINYAIIRCDTSEWENRDEMIDELYGVLDTLSFTVKQIHDSLDRHTA